MTTTSSGRARPSGRRPGERVPMTLFADRPARARAIYGHPDDPEVACGGTLARWSAEGAEVRLVVVNAGDKGSFDATTDPEVLTERRAGEVTAAAKVMGLAGVDLLGVPDGEAVNDLALRGRLVGLVRNLRPEVVVGP